MLRLRSVDRISRIIIMLLGDRFKLYAWKKAVFIKRNWKTVDEFKDNERKYKSIIRK